MSRCLAFACLLTGASAESLCNDKRSDCATKAAVAEWCQNDNWAAVTCPFSCGYCGENRPVNRTDCQDTDVHCAWWAQSGECDTNPEMMRRTCPTSCSMCADRVCGGRGGNGCASSWVSQTVGSC